MNKSNLKSYAPQARKDFIAAITARAALLGITSSHTAPAVVSGGVAIIEGVEWPAKVAAQREKLLQRIARQGQGGFAQTMEEVAYTWFNRFAALRYMELHDFLDHGHRVLSSRDGGLPELLRHAADVTLPGLQAAKVQELQLAGTQDNQLYKLLLVAQCNALSAAMPFLFERIDDDTELLLPDHLLRTDSIIAKLVAGVPEEDWQEIEVIGWLYQFYISEKKDQVIGKVVKSEDIPAATQLFTPNWIVQYLVQNSVGRLWLMANPGSQLASEWPYYIAPAEQTPEVQAQLDALIQTRIAEDGDTLNPETITCLDPACGSGHILVVAYDVLKAIYLERGYRLRDIPRLILEKNLYGLDIDDRAAQLAGFALLMKARADDRRLLANESNPPRLNILSLQESTGLDAQALHAALTAGHSTQASPRAPDAGFGGFADTDLFPATRPQMTLGESALLPHPQGAPDLLPLPLGEGGGEGGFQTTIAWLIKTFAHAKTFGSLIQIDPQRLPSLREQLSILKNAQASGDLYAQAAAKDLLPLVRQALVLGMQFDAVVANPPYMGSKYYCQSLTKFVNGNYSTAFADIYACFMLACLRLCKPSGLVTNINIPGWMMNSTFEGFRLNLFGISTIVSLAHNGRGVFGSDFGSCAFTLINQPLTQMRGVFHRLFDDPSTVQSNEALSERFFQARGTPISPAEFQLIKGAPLSYQVSQRVRQAYRDLPSISEVSTACQGLSTSDDNSFVRLWYEVSTESTSFTGGQSGKTWYAYNKGGVFRKWFGNQEHVINWEEQGKEIKLRKPKSVIRNERHYFKPSISWQDYTIGANSFRYYPSGFIFATNAHSAFVEQSISLMNILCFSNSKVLSSLSEAIAPGLHFNSGYFALIPFNADAIPERVSEIAKRSVVISEADWDAFERSWNFTRSPLIEYASNSLPASYQTWLDHGHQSVRELKDLEEESNSIFISAYRLADELSPEVAIQQITLTVNPPYRYGDKLTESEQWTRFRQSAMEELISYAIGCMMGRYSLDAPGLIYAHAGNVGFDASRYPTFAADADGILPVTDQPWFADDAPTRIREFLRAVWGPDTLEENLAWLAESLGPKASETPEETIRRYVANQFFKDHLQTYKKRPIYWLFSSGKQGAFQALVYLHRYHEGTLARMRAEYIIPLTAKMTARLEMLEQDAAAASSAAGRTKIRKQIEALRKQQTELLAYDEKLRHFADMRITLDLDDGVKVNYGKFGDLLEGVKLVTGGAGDE